MKTSSRAATYAAIGLMFATSITSFNSFSRFKCPRFPKPPAPLVDTVFSTSCAKLDSLYPNAGALASYVDSLKQKVKPKVAFKKQTLKQARKLLLGMGKDAAFVDSLLSDSRVGKYELFKKAAPDTAQQKKQKKPLTYERYKELYHYNQLREGGKTFLQKYSCDLAAAQDSTGTPVELTTSILAIETIYASYTGELECFNVLLSLLEDSRKWAPFARSELSFFMKVCDKFNIDPFSVKGSERAAFTPGQFLASSFVKYDVLAEGASFEYACSIQYAISMVSRYLKDAGASMDSEFAVKSRNYKAAFAYNHHPYYARFVMELASDLRKNAEIAEK